MSAVVCANVVKSYQDNRVVDGVSFEIHQGEIFGMIGPNGRKDNSYGVRRGPAPA